jgi:ribose/xylose/arabinose/galactoside ABC-type transport system permease subunit
MRNLFSFNEAGILTVTILVIVLFQTINPVFLSGANVTSILRSTAYVGIIAVGMAVCLMSGTLDLSVGATAGLASVIAAEVMVKWGWPLAAGFASGVAIGFFVGLLNGIVITKLKVNAFISTIAMSFIVKGIANSICSGFSVYPLPGNISDTANLRPGGLSLAFWIMVVIMIIVFIILRETVLGLEIRATGSDRESAICTEVNVDAVNIKTLSFVGGLAGLSGVLLTTVLNAGTPTLGGGWELIIITACAIGGVSLTGYEGSMLGLFLGLLFLQVIQNGLVMIGVSAYLQPVSVGIILMISMILDTRRRRYLNLEKI